MKKFATLISIAILLFASSAFAQKTWKLYIHSWGPGQILTTTIHDYEYKAGCEAAIDMMFYNVAGQLDPSNGVSVYCTEDSVKIHYEHAMGGLKLPQ